MHCSQIGAGRMGATPQPKATIASYGNKHCKARKSTGPTVSGVNQRPLEDIDTVGVTGSIPVSPTMEAPDPGASIHFRGLAGVGLSTKCQRDLAACGGTVHPGATRLSRPEAPDPKRFRSEPSRVSSHISGPPRRRAPMFPGDPSRSRRRAARRGGSDKLGRFGPPDRPINLNHPRDSGAAVVQIAWDGTVADQDGQRAGVKGSHACTPARPGGNW